MRLGALSPWWDRGVEAWGGRSTREQRLLAVLGALALAAFVLLAIVRPLEAARARSEAAIRIADNLVLRVRAAGPSLATQAQRGPPATMVARSAALAGVSVQRVEPEGGRLSVVLADAPFDAVLRFVADLEQTSTLRVSEARIGLGVAGGTVSAQFLLAGG